MSSLPPEEQTAERKLRAASVFLAVIVVALFSPAFSSQFTNWDDPVLVTENPLIRSLSWTNIKAIFSFSSIQEFKHYIPLVLLSYSVEHAIAGLNPSIFHSTNVSCKFY